MRCVTHFTRVNDESVRWARNRSATLVTEVNAATREGIREAVSMSIREGLPPRKTARLIRDMVGLTGRDVRAVANLRERMIARGISGVSLDRQSQSYANKLLRRRTENIVRTETMSAASQGQAELWRQAAEDGLLPSEVNRVWIVTPDDRLCEVCEPMDGQVVAAGEMFVTGDGDEVEMPPAHPSCRCSWGLTTEKVAAQEPRVSAGMYQTPHGSMTNLSPDKYERFHDKFESS